MASVRTVRSDAITPSELTTIRRLLDVAFDGRFDDHDWDHALGGVHLLGEAEGVLVAHASVVTRTLTVGDRDVATGYVEAVATSVPHQHRGHGRDVMMEVARVIEDGFELGALSTSSPRFYEKLGWTPWRGPTFARTPAGDRVRTADEDGGVLVLRTPATRDVDAGASLTCDWRTGDVW